MRPSEQASTESIHDLSVRVRIPATTANLGAGFDSMGMALDLWNTFELQASPPGAGLHVDCSGEGACHLPQDKTNLVVQVMNEELLRAGSALPQDVSIQCHNEVPCGSGMGSSSTAVLAGVIFAHAIQRYREGVTWWVPGEDHDAVLSRAVEIEGHGDNVAPALLGGLRIVYTSGPDFMTRPIPFPPTRVVVCVPDYDYPTSRARAALPQSVHKSDAVFNIGRAMLTIEALRNGDDRLLAHAMDDRIHEQYRLPDIPGAVNAKAAAIESGAIAVCLSGAGPGLIAFARSRHREIGEAMVASFTQMPSRYWVLDAISNGAHVSMGLVGG